MGIFMGFSWWGDPRPGREQQVSQMNASWAPSVVRDDGARKRLGKG